MNETKKEVPPRRLWIGGGEDMPPARLPAPARAEPLRAEAASSAPDLDDCDTGISER